jgi:uncharacterized protein YjbI with pentapeptide repeats
VAFNPYGDLWLTDFTNNRVLEFVPPFSDGMSASLVLGQSSFTANNGETSQSGLYAPIRLTFDSYGNLWVVDYANNRIIEYLSGANQAAPLPNATLQKAYMQGTAFMGVPLPNASSRRVNFQGTNLQSAILTVRRTKVFLPT